MEMKIINNQVEINKVITELDKFIFSFINILKKTTDYVIVSGYVSIFFGRSRATEDVDILIPKLKKIEFYSLFNNLIKNNFYCLNTDKKATAFEYLTSNNALRFAKKGTVIPNIELKFCKNLVDLTSLKDKIVVKTKDNSLNLAPIELQILYKKLKLCSPKDIEDARYLELIFKDSINREKLNKYKVLLTLK